MIYDGYAPNNHLKKSFKVLQQEMQKAYPEVKNSPIDVDIHPNVKSVLIDMLGGPNRVTNVTKLTPLQATVAGAKIVYRSHEVHHREKENQPSGYLPTEHHINQKQQELSRQWLDAYRQK
jgi:hypothetical protein